MTSRFLLLTLVALVGVAAVVAHARRTGAQPRVVMMASTIGPIDTGIAGAPEEASSR
jgi:hypothetical protein